VQLKCKKIITLKVLTTAGEDAGFPSVKETKRNTGNISLLVVIKIYWQNNKHLKLIQNDISRIITYM